MTVINWAAHISEAWKSSVEGIIETGRRIARAKEFLEHGQFGHMVRAELPFGQNMAEKLMVIAASPRISSISKKLPANWTTIYELVTVSDAVFEAIKEDIKPDMKGKDIALVKRSLEPERAPSYPRKPKIDATEQAVDEALQIGAAAGVCSVLADVTLAELARGDRDLQAVNARKMALYIAHTELGVSQTRLGTVYSMDRTNVHHSVEDIEKRRDNPELDRDLTRATLALRKLQSLSIERL